MASMAFLISLILTSSRQAAPSIWRSRARAACSSSRRTASSRDSAASMLASTRRSNCCMAARRTRLACTCSSRASRSSLRARRWLPPTLVAALGEDVPVPAPPAPPAPPTTAGASVAALAALISSACVSFACEVSMSRLCSAATSSRGAWGGFCGAASSTLLKSFSACARFRLASIWPCRNSACSRLTAWFSACLRASSATFLYIWPLSSTRSRMASEARVSRAVIWRCNASSWALCSRCDRCDWGGRTLAAACGPGSLARSGSSPLRGVPAVDPQLPPAPEAVAGPL
mmetsp:Transcript_85404/g.276546  ORF Transcript_85404/g.276546 Transcript_85404/m.276546 type:complete len:288 (-) Transcript_85404:784-1647(-)